MPDAARQRAASGVDVVAGYIGARTRPEAMALLQGLENLQPRELNYHGVTRKELDLDEILERKWRRCRSL